MAKEIILTDAEFLVLVAVDGSPACSQMPPEIKARLTELRLVERRAWPNGPLWRTGAGDRLVRRGKLILDVCADTARRQAVIGPPLHEIAAQVDHVAAVVGLLNAVSAQMVAPPGPGQIRFNASVSTATVCWLHRKSAAGFDIRQRLRSLVKGGAVLPDITLYIQDKDDATRYDIFSLLTFTATCARQASASSRGTPLSAHQSRKLDQKPCTVACTSP